MLWRKAKRPSIRPATTGLSRRGSLALVLSAGLVLSGCGFQPMYGANNVSLNDTPATAELRSVYVRQDGDGRFGQLLRNEMVNIMGEPTRPEYTVTLESTVFKAGIAVGLDATATRFDYIAYTEMVLRTRPQTDENGVFYPAAVIMTYNGTATAPFDQPVSPAAEVFQEREAEKRTAKLLAQQLVQRLATFFSSEQQQRRRFP
ncbi:MAG: hypothetical protein ACPGOY_08705 [Rhodospirillaceae bacterium]